MLTVLPKLEIEYYVSWHLRFFGLHFTDRLLPSCSDRRLFILTPFVSHVHRAASYYQRYNFLLCHVLVEKTFIYLVIYRTLADKKIDGHRRRSEEPTVHVDNVDAAVA
jgi:hypothetical protein